MALVDGGAKNPSEAVHKKLEEMLVLVPHFDPFPAALLVRADSGSRCVRRTLPAILQGAPIRSRGETGERTPRPGCRRVWTGQYVRASGAASRCVMTPPEFATRARRCVGRMAESIGLRPSVNGIARGCGGFGRV